MKGDEGKAEGPGSCSCARGGAHRVVSFCMYVTDGANRTSAQVGVVGTEERSQDGSKTLV